MLFFSACPERVTRSVLSEWEGYADFQGLFVAHRNRILYLMLHFPRTEWKNKKNLEYQRLVQLLSNVPKKGMFWGEEAAVLEILGTRTVCRSI